MRAWWFALIAIGAAVLGGAAWWYTSSQFTALFEQTAALPSEQSVPSDIGAVRNLVVSVLASAPDYSAFFGNMRTNFGGDYDKDLTRFADRAIARGHMEGPDVYFTDAYRALRQARGIVAAKASPPAMSRIFNAQAATLKVMGEVDPHLCTDALYGGATNAYFAFATAHRVLVAEEGNASLAAIIDGMPVKDEIATATDADVQAFDQALSARGLSGTEVAALTGGAPSSTIPDARFCEIGQIYQATLKSLPEEQRWRMYRLALELAAHS